MTDSQRILITGGAGFIGTNAALGFMQRGYAVTILDSMARPGSDANTTHLGESAHASGASLRVIVSDVRDAAAMHQAVAEVRPDVILHLAAQVAVTTSVKDPAHDFDVNAQGTFNVLEAARLADKQPLVIFASTNKVYGGMEDIGVEIGAGLTAYEADGRHRYTSLPLGIPETQNLDFHSPYGCSKGAADQYVRDYARIYGLKTAVMRQSCIYGPRQFGVEDQGWVAWFTIAAIFGRPFHIFGDGLQVRDVLHVDDLVNAYVSVVQRRDEMTGRIFNIGGGAAFSLSLRGLIRMLEERLGCQLDYDMNDWRPGDQPVYIGDIRKAASELGWSPLISPAVGIDRLFNWVRDNQALIRTQLGPLLQS